MTMVRPRIAIAMDRSTPITPAPVPPAPDGRRLRLADGRWRLLICSFEERQASFRKTSPLLRLGQAREKALGNYWPREQPGTQPMHGATTRRHKCETGNCRFNRAAQCRLNEFRHKVALTA